jgi:uncharacterized protein (DUF2141 family)
MSFIAFSLRSVVTRTTAILLTVAPVSLLMATPGTYAADLTVVVQNIQKDTGSVMMGLFSTPESFPKNVTKGMTVAAAERDATGRVTLVLRDLAPGQYAVSAFHDVDGNGRLNSNLMGMPTEPYGFSNDAQAQFAPPAFSAAAFTLPAQGLTIQLQVK